MKLLHTADLQLGARFAQFGDQAEFLREARKKAPKWYRNPGY